MFYPHLGRLAPATPENVQAAVDGKLQVNMPWLEEGAFSEAAATSQAEDHSYSTQKHPVTGITDTFSLFDWFHQGNCTRQEEILRRVGLVPQLAGLINTQTAEQLHRSIGRDHHFLDLMSPSNHCFMLRLLLDNRNESKNKKVLLSTSQNLGKVPVLGQDGRVRATNESLGKVIIMHS